MAAKEANEIVVICVGLGDWHLPLRSTPRHKPHRTIGRTLRGTLLLPRMIQRTTARRIAHTQDRKTPRRPMKWALGFLSSSALEAPAACGRTLSSA